MEVFIMRKITTDNKWKSFKYRNEVPDTVLKDRFSHLSDEDTDGYFKYRNHWYHTSDFLRTEIPGWNGIHSDSAFSGVLLKISKDGERYQVGTVTC
jgi:hypothetical protein